MSDDDESDRLADPPPRPVAVTWVWPKRWLLSIGSDISTVLTDVEVGLLADATAGAVRGGAGVYGV
jgi:hypothetical protein